MPLSADRPGCFGHATTYNSDQKICQLCNYASDCRESAQRALEHLRKIMTDSRMTDKFPIATAQLTSREKIEVTAPDDEATEAPRTEDLLVEAPPEPTPAPAPLVSVMSKKATKLHASLVKQGVDLKAEILNASKAPLQSIKGLAYLKIGIAMMRARGSYETKAFAERLIVDLGWTSGTAQSHATIVTSLLCGIGVARKSASLRGTVEMIEPFEFAREAE